MYHVPFSRAQCACCCVLFRLLVWLNISEVKRDAFWNENDPHRTHTHNWFVVWPPHSTHTHTHNALRYKPLLHILNTIVAIVCTPIVIFAFTYNTYNIVMLPTTPAIRWACAHLLNVLIHSDILILPTQSVAIWRKDTGGRGIGPAWKEEGNVHFKYTKSGALMCCCCSVAFACFYLHIWAVDSSFFCNSNVLLLGIFFFWLMS